MYIFRLAVFLSIASTAKPSVLSTTGTRSFLPNTLIVSPRTDSGQRITQLAAEKVEVFCFRFTLRQLGDIDPSVQGDDDQPKELQFSERAFDILQECEAARE